MHSLAELLAHALAMEVEAAERYEALAEQMNVHNNPPLAELFTSLARVERLHAAQIRARAGAASLPHIPAWEYRWRDPEGPETAPFDVVDHRTTPQRALAIALHNERRAETFFTGIEHTAADAQVRALAAELAEEEREHVRLVERWLARYPADPDTPAEDPDPPLAQG